jgi:hypothetical protein
MLFVFYTSFIFYLIWFFGDMVSLYGPGWPRTPDLPASASQVLALQACATMPDLFLFFN